METQQLIWQPTLNTWQEQLISTLNTSSILNQTVHVSKSGSDDLGNGSDTNPYFTIAYALSLITNANENNRYIVYVGPGEYADPWKIKPWTAVVGLSGGNGVSPNGGMVVEITAAVDSLGFSSDWDSSGFAIGWMNGLGFQNHQTWQEDGYMSPQLNFLGCTFNDGSSFIGPGIRGSDNVMLDDCLIYGGLSVKGWQFLWTRNCDFLGGTVSILAGPPNATEDTIWLSQGSSVGSFSFPTNINIYQDGYSPHFARADLSNTSVLGVLNIDGYLTSYHSTLEGIPCSVTLVNGAVSPILISCANSLAYNPLVDGYWATLPTSVSDALDQLAAKSSGGGRSQDYSLFFALMPGDNSSTIAVGAALQFPQDGPSSGVITRVGSSTFNLPKIGDYEIAWQVSIDEPGQLQLAIGGVGLAQTVVGRSTGTNQLYGNTIISTVIANSILSVINPLGNSTALTVTPIAGGANAISATLTIKSL